MGDLLIAGIDPGTTVGYALLDLNGKLVKTGSSKELDFNKVIKEISSVGIPIIACSDKKRVPDFTEKFSIKTGARLINPEKDLSVKDKREITKQYNIKDIHQIDSLASALHAYKSIRSLLKKIDVFVKHNKKQKIVDKIKEIVIREEISIKSACDIIEKSNEKEASIVKNVIEEKRITKKDFLELYDSFRVLKKDNELLKKQMQTVNKEAKRVEKKENYINKKIDQLNNDEKIEKVIKQREKKENSLVSKIKKRDNEIELVTEEKCKLRKLLSGLGNRLLLKKLDNLGKDEFAVKSKGLNINKGDVLLVQDCNIFSKSVIEQLKGKVELVVFNKATKKIIDELPFVFVDSKNLDIDEESLFASVDKNEFEKAKKESDILNKIVDDYRVERNNL